MPAHDRSPAFYAVMTSLKTLLLLLVTVSLVAWDLPFMSRRARGDNRFAEGNYAEAIEHYTRAAEIDAANWEIHYNLGTSYYKEGYWDSAVTELQLAADLAESIGASPSDLSHIWHNLGLAYLQLDDCENAVPAFAKAQEYDESDEDVTRNAEFAMEYCESETEDAEQNEGETEDEGEGDQDQEEEGQNDEGESNDESEVQDDSEESEEGEQQDESENESDEGENESDEGENQQDESGDSGEDEGEQESEQSDDEQGEGGEETPDESGTEKETETENQDAGEQEKENAGESESGGNRSQGSPNEIPDDGLNLSNEQIEQLLRRMSNLERSRAPRYFNNTPNDGDYLDDESLTDLIRRLFLGLPPEKYEEMPDDGIDW